jgi:periplasmic divalent cation tolerance protein
MDGPCCVVLCTFPDESTAATIGRTLVDERLAACVNVVPAIRSIYRWQGQVQEDGEALALVKTTAAGFPALRDRLLALHPYDCPECIALPVTAGHPAYLEWIAASVA